MRRLLSLLTGSTLAVLMVLFLAQTHLSAQRSTRPSSVRSPRFAARVVDLRRQLVALSPDPDSDRTDVEFSFAVTQASGALVHMQGSLADFNTGMSPGHRSHSRPFYWSIDTKQHSFAVFYLTGDDRADAARIHAFAVKHGDSGGRSSDQIAADLRSARTAAATATSPRVHADRSGSPDQPITGGPNTSETLYCQGDGFLTAYVVDPINIQTSSTTNWADWGYWTGDAYGIDYADSSPECDTKPDDWLSTWYNTRCEVLTDQYGCDGVDNNAVAEYYNDDFILDPGAETDVFSYAAVNVSDTAGVTWEADNYISGEGWDYHLLSGQVGNGLNEDCYYSDGRGACNQPPPECESLDYIYCSDMCYWPYYGATDDLDCNGVEDWFDCEFMYGDCPSDDAPVPAAFSAGLAPLAGIQFMCGVSCLGYARRRRR